MWMCDNHSLRSVSTSSPNLPYLRQNISTISSLSIKHQNSEKASIPLSERLAPPTEKLISAAGPLASQIKRALPEKEDFY